MKEGFISKTFSQSTLDIIRQANAICDEYARQGYNLTLRQLYYQFVARGFIPNRDTEYKRLGGIVNDARMAGRMDWSYIEDRTRNLASLAHWTEPSDIIDACVQSFRLDRWVTQDHHVEVWVEKEALAGIVERAAQGLDVPYFSCRGYTSQSEMYGAAKRFISYSRRGKTNILIHLGDHDPSGIDMTRDIEDRLYQFGARVQVERIALNMDQVEQYNPPPNPAKLTDSRCAGYIDRFGDESWELDALDPVTLGDLISTTVRRYIDQGAWSDTVSLENRYRGELRFARDNWTSRISNAYVEDGEVSEDTEEDDEDDPDA